MIVQYLETIMRSIFFTSPYILNASYMCILYLTVKLDDVIMHKCVKLIEV